MASGGSSSKIPKPLRIGHNDALKSIALGDRELAVDQQMVLVTMSEQKTVTRWLTQREKNFGLTPPDKHTHPNHPEVATSAVGFIYMVRTRDDGKTRITYILTSAVAVPVLCMKKSAIWVTNPRTDWQSDKVIRVDYIEDLAILHCEGYPREYLPKKPCQISAYRPNNATDVRFMGYTADTGQVMVAKATFMTTYRIKALDPRATAAPISVHLGAPVLTANGDVCAIVVKSIDGARNNLVIFELTTNRLREDLFYFDDTSKYPNPFGETYPGWEQLETGRWRRSESPMDLDPDTAVRNSPVSDVAMEDVE